jgi:hypothetical protein
MFKSLIILAVAAGASLLGASARAEDGRGLVKNCMSNDRMIVGVCVGYLLGIWDTAVDMPLYGKVVRSDRICLPEGEDGPKPSEMPQIWLEWAHRHPEHLDFAAARLVMQAFIDAYPCREG